MIIEEFKITARHIVLLRSMYVSWSDAEFGAPTIDPKRPYGDSGVIDDVRAILASHDLLGPGMSDEAIITLHKEMRTALQILLKCGPLSAGIYSRTPPRDNWAMTYG